MSSPKEAVESGQPAEVVFDPLTMQLRRIDARLRGIDMMLTAANPSGGAWFATEAQQAALRDIYEAITLLARERRQAKATGADQ